MPREDKPIRWKTLLVLLAVALGLGSLYRFTDLAKKPVHTDEANLALKTQEYWKSGTFEYDKVDHHGPFLHHVAKWMGSLRGWHAESLTEDQLRWVVAVCGLLLVLTPLLFLDVIGRTGAGVAALLLALSPMMTYYSRYYIMETPFVLLITLFIAMMWQWGKRKNKWWLLPAGVVLGLLHATKETFVLNIAALVAGCVVVKFLGLRFEINQRGYGFRSFTSRPKPWWSWIIFAAAAVLASTWMFSNGFREWNYVTESVSTYQSYLGRSQGAGGHEKPWHYYLTLLFWRRQGFLWSEALIGGLAIIGMINAFLDQRRADHKRAFLIAFSTYTIVLLVIYCAIPYKTPWSAMGIDYAFALLAGLGARTFFRAFTDAPVIKGILALALAGGIYHLCRETSLATDYNFAGKTLYADSEMRNPYAYSHTSTNLVELVAYLHSLAKKHPAGKAMPVQVIHSEQGWPLPWYLRDMTHVGYQSNVPDKIDAPVIVVDPEHQPLVTEKLKGDYETTFWRLRTNNAIILLVDKSILGQQADNAGKAKPVTELAPAPPSPTPGVTPAPAPPSPAPDGATTPAPNPTMPATPGEPVVPKAQLVEDDPPFVGPPYPVPEPTPATRPNN